MERSRQISEPAGRRDAIRSTATSIAEEARSREQWPCEHGPSMQVRSKSPEPIGCTRKTTPYRRVPRTWAGLAGRTRNEAESEQLAPEEERHEELHS